MTTLTQHIIDVDDYPTWHRLPGLPLSTQPLMITHIQHSTLSLMTTHTQHSVHIDDYPYPA